MDSGFFELPFFMVPGSSRAGRVVWIFRCFWHVVLFQNSSGGLTCSIGTATFSCSTTKCAEPSSELLGGCLKMVLTHLMVPCLSLALLLCVFSAAAVSVCTVQAFYKQSAELSTKASLEGSPELIDL